MTTYPTELATYLGTLPFLGRVTCSHREVTAGALEEILVIYEVGAAALADGAGLKLVFKFYSDWGLFQTTHPERANYLTASYVPRAPFAGESPATVRQLKVRFDQKGHERPFQKAVLVDVVDGYLKPGDRIEFRMGDRRFGGPGTRVQTFVEEAFTFRCLVDTAGTSRFAQVPGDLLLCVRAGWAKREVLISPRLVRPGIRFSVTFRREDEWGNLAVQDPSSTEGLVVWRGDQEAARFPFIQGAASGWGRVELHLDQPGDYELSMGQRGARVHLTVTSDAPMPRALFADLHIHSEDTVGVNTTRYNLSYARDAAGLDVAGYTANDFNVRADCWTDAVRICAELHVPGRFLCFPGTEWCGSSAVGGDRNVIFLGREVRFPFDRTGKSLRVFDWNEDSPRGKNQEAQLWPASALHAAYRDLGDDILLIPHVGGRRANFDWHDSQLERLIEVASSWGHFDWFYRDALARGLKVGVSAAGDEHRGRPGGGAPGVGSFGVPGGLTGVLSNELTSRAVGEALRGRRTWATTGTRSVALLASGRYRQGDEFAATGALEVNYRLFGDAGWERVELRDDQGDLLLVRDLDQELGYAPGRFRVRWGGARIRDRYRWAEWHGMIRISGTNVQRWQAGGLEHSEETILHEAPDAFRIRTDTYGDSDYIEFEVTDLARAEVHLHFEVGAYNKISPGLEQSRDLYVPILKQTVRGGELLKQQASPRWELGGAELFVSVERLTGEALPRRLEGQCTIQLTPGPHSHRAITLFARERNDAKVWTSPLFVEMSH